MEQQKRLGSQDDLKLYAIGSGVRTKFSPQISN